MGENIVAGIDIGGTKIAVALQNFDKKIVASGSFPTRVEIGPHRILANIVCNIEKMLAETETTLSAIGIGCPGPLDIENGLVLSPTNLPDWTDFPIVEIIKKKFDVPVAFDNDANAAALGEFFSGAGKGFSDILYVTISTGIGGAIICGGQIHHGLGASAGEIGHAIVQPDGELCRCGTKGCLETLASGVNIARRTKERLAQNDKSFEGVNSEEITARTVIEAVKNGDETALEIWDETMRFLAIGIGNAITTIAPQAVIIGGGVSMAGELLLEPLRSFIKQNVKMLPIEKVKILQASLGSESGIYGALILAQQAINNH